MEQRKQISCRYIRKKGVEIFQVMIRFKVCRNGIEMFRVRILNLEFWKIYKAKVEVVKIYDKEYVRKEIFKLIN